MREIRLEPPDGSAAEVTFDLRVGPGDRVGPADVVCEASTDKATVELQAGAAFRVVDVVKTRRGYVLVVEDLPEDR